MHTDEELDAECQKRFGLSLDAIVKDLDYGNPKYAKQDIQGLFSYLTEIEKPYDQQEEGYWHEHLGDAGKDFKLMNDIVKLMMKYKK